MRELVAIVPARHYSQRVDGKNYRLLGPYPLYYHILSTLTQISEISRIIVDTDSTTISQGIEKWFPNRIEILQRPTNLCSPEISMNQILLSIINRTNLCSIPETLIFQTHVTNPFLRASSISQMINSHNFTGTSMTVSPAKKRIWTAERQPINHNPGELLQTQDLAPIYEENSCGYLFTVADFLQHHNRLTPQLQFYPIELGESLDIDTEEDFQLAEAWYRHQTHMAKSANISSDAPKVHTDEEIYQALHRCVDFKGKMLSDFRVLISAPYMMSNINAFIKFLHEDLGMIVHVAPVKERLSEEELLSYSGQYDLSLIGDDHYTDRVLKSCGAKVISKWGTGIDSIDQVACKKYGISLKNTPDAFSIPVAESVLAAILGFLRQTYTSDQQMSYTNDWVKLPGRILGEVTVGVIGYGNVGRQVVADLANLGTRRILVNEIYDLQPFCNSNTEITSFEYLLMNSDIICICCDFRDGNHHLISRRQLSLMKPGSYIINMARGGLIDLVALTDALQSNHLGGAALDVFETEPLPESSPLRRMSNVLLSSHNANSSPKHWLKVHINTINQGLQVLHMHRISGLGDSNN